MSFTDATDRVIQSQFRAAAVAASGDGVRLVLASESARPLPVELALMLRNLGDLLNARAATLRAAGDKAGEPVKAGGLCRYAASQIEKHTEVFEFGHLPDAVLRENAKRAGPLLGAGMLSTPFEVSVFWYVLEPDLDRTPKLLEALGMEVTAADVVPRRFASVAVRLWTKGHDEEQGCNTQAFLVADLIVLDAEERDALGAPRSAKTVLAFEGVGLVFTQGSGDWSGELLFSMSESLALARNAPPDVLASARQLALGSLADGVAAASMILSTKGVRRRTDEPPAKVQAKRARAGKRPLVRVTYVDTQHYIEAAANTAARGSHASPVPHLRRGHRRVLRSGRAVWVRDMLVNCRSVAELPGRDHYEVKG